MQKGFVKYIQQGEEYFAGPVAIMGGLVDSPLNLVHDFVRIALYSIWQHLYEAGILGFPLALLHSCMLVVNAVGIILPPMRDELR